MREVKFRAWDKTTKRWAIGVELFEVVPVSATLLDTPAIITVGKEESEWRFQQFTGLHDKNGKDIYEGDVVLVPDTYTQSVDVGIGSVPVDRYPDNHLSEVIFEDGCFKIVVRERGDVLWKANYNFECLKEEVGLEELVVIGNIYENPDLLKV